MTRRTVHTEHGTVEVRPRESRYADVEGLEVYRDGRFVGLVVPNGDGWEAMRAGHGPGYAIHEVTVYDRQADAVTNLAGVSKEWDR